MPVTYPGYGTLSLDPPGLVRVGTVSIIKVEKQGVILMLSRKQNGMGIASVLVAIGLFVGISLLNPISAPAAPTVEWTPSSLATEVAINHSKIMDVSFTSSETANNVVLNVVPELQSFVQVNPSSFSSIPKGQVITVHITVAPSAGAHFGTVQGTIQLRIGRTLAKPLPVNILITVVPLPPDPGEAGKASIAGIDADGDGVRDDIQRYIALTYPTSEKTRAALTQYARSLQSSLLDSNDKPLSIIDAQARIDAINCLSYILGQQVSSNAFAELRGLALNTIDRSQAYIRANAQFSGHLIPSVSPAEQRVKCTFDPDAMGD